MQPRRSPRNSMATKRLVFVSVVLLLLFIVLFTGAVNEGMLFSGKSGIPTGAVIIERNASESLLEGTDADAMETFK